MAKQTQMSEHLFLRVSAEDRSVLLLEGPCIVTLLFLCYLVVPIRAAWGTYLVVSRLLGLL